MAKPTHLAPAGPAWRLRLYTVIFEAETPLGKAFDVALLVLIVASVGSVMLESVSDIRQRYGAWLRFFEWAATLLFTAEYALRLLCVGRPIRYATSFFGVVDLLSVVPTYVSLIFPGTQSLLAIRALRLLRIFRVFKLAHLVHQERLLFSALRASVGKIVVFLGLVVTLMIILGTLMYLVEGHEHGFTSIPRSIYWAVVTMTTVGYGDIAPQTVLGQSLATVVMLLGYAIIAVPTGIVTASMTREEFQTRSEAASACLGCERAGHDTDARHCKHCGLKLDP